MLIVNVVHGSILLRLSLVGVFAKGLFSKVRFLISRQQSKGLNASIKARNSSAANDRAIMKTLLSSGLHSSEDYFKLWPEDKSYFFTKNLDAGLAYKVKRGIALIVSDPIATKDSKTLLFEEFLQLCKINKWSPAVIHTKPGYSEFYKKQGFQLQKIGEEAIVDVEHFIKFTSKNKYFRHISNKLTNQGYSCELLLPPHSKENITALKRVSVDWLDLPGRGERGFMIGYLSEEYMQASSVMVLRDNTGRIQAFINQITSYDPKEANFDLLRYSKVAPGNANDFLLATFIGYLAKKGVKSLNLGLCPLSGLENSDSDQNIINNVLQFVYANGDRFYSFSGLRRFKAKYQPEWKDRYIAYKGGISGFTRVMNALNQAMKR